jgi:hypothetical protein
MATRDKTLFVEMGLPVSLQYLYERHKVPSPSPSEALFIPGQRPPSEVAQASSLPSSPSYHVCACGCATPITAASDGARKRGDGHAAGVAPKHSEGASDCGCPSCGRDHSQTAADALSASSESAQELAARQAAAQAAFPGLVRAANDADEYLVWDATLDSVTTPLCQGRHGRRWGDGWFVPPPAHYNCRSTLKRVPKASYTSPDAPPSGRSGITE